MQKITPFLWFNTEAEEAAKFYTSIFKDSKLGSVAPYDEAGAKASGMPAGSIMVVTFQLNGQDFTAINGGPHFKFNEAVSFVVNCETQEEVDYYWEKLTEGGDPKAQQCGWLKDKFGLSWQIVPGIIPQLMQAGGERSKKVMQAVLQMKKIDIAKVKEAAEK